MSIFLKDKNRRSLGIGVCDRCKTKYYLDQLEPDRDTPGMRVCDKCNDEYDPWKLPARDPDQITLDHPRPDERLGFGPDDN